MIPCVVIDTETTGFPSKRPGGFRARMIEVGAVVITSDLKVVSPISFFVRQSRSHLESWQAKKAMGVHGIPIETVLREGLVDTEAAPRLARWIDKVKGRFGVQEVRAYNQQFDFWFLEQAPWSLFERTGLRPGEDIMDTAQRAMGTSSRPKLHKAVEYAGQTGKSIAWQGDAHRAEEDARMAAMVAVRFGQTTE